MKRRLALAPLAVGMLLTATACGGQTEGQPLPDADETGSTGTGTTSSAAPTSESGSSGPLADIKACELLPDSAEAKLNVGAGKPKTLGSARSCSYITQEPAGESTPLAIDIREGQGLKDFTEVYAKSVDTTISGRQAKLQSKYGNTLIAIAVTEHSRVDVTATNAVKPEQAKAFAKKAAKLVAQHLPKG